MFVVVVVFFLSFFFFFVNLNISKVEFTPTPFVSSIFFVSHHFKMISSYLFIYYNLQRFAIPQTQV